MHWGRFFCPQCRRDTGVMKKLTEGNPFKVIILFSIPLLIGQLFQLFYNLVDTRIVGETLGESALAAVGATTTLSDLIVQFIVGVTSGFAILVAHFFGAKDRKNLKKTIGGTLLLGVLASLLITVVCLVLLDPFLHLLNIEEAIYTDAKGYIRIILAGLIFTALYNICAGVLRAIGDTITPLIFLIFSAFVNIVLDYTLILYAHMGVEGAALATVLSQVLSVVLCFGYIRRKYVDLIPGINELRPDKELYHKLLQSGISMGFMSSFVNLGTLFLQTCINTFGAVTIVSHAASRKLTSIFMLPFGILGMTMATYCGQNMGAGKYDRIRTGIKDALIIAGVWCVFVVFITYPFTPKLVHMITSLDNPVILQTSAKYLRINSTFYFITAIICLFRNAMQGFGDTKTPIFSSLLELLTKLLIAFFLAPQIGYFGIIISEPIAWAIMVIPLIVNMLRWERMHRSS